MSASYKETRSTRTAALGEHTASMSTLTATGMSAWQAGLRSPRCDTQASLVQRQSTHQLSRMYRLSACEMYGGLA